MPELPEVQTVVNDLNAAGLVGATITNARVFWARTIDTLSPKAFCRQITGQTVQQIWRRGKYIVMDFTSGDHLLIHLRMSGRLHWVTSDAARSPHEHVLLTFETGRQLRFHDTRKFGRMYLVHEVSVVLGQLGPEPLAKGFTAKLLADRLQGRHRLLKPLLLDQTFIAGLGNIYADEALWAARLHPLRLSSSLSFEEVTRLHRAIRSVLRRGIKNLGTTLGAGSTNFYSLGRAEGRNREQLKVFRRTDQPCPRCQTPIERIIVGQRSTHICTTCQPL
ncbi:DNA-formamidopyrimidine glycosylase [candidate division KSB3 bacterium]|uniref:DNA-formamidopyrimidine glycosylase n=1 Tax=candidate division KSB3 bacterium TaxID=2044937 RepID=A0A9D5JTU7_9BACT|nr:DNA-formamidopyrimidine glycosylase [candidate division KSB3 bacterium]MBD3324129.1 DNA-formamidopyrimidine glycosylase [candidate division KSB3 bacterium]